MPFRNRNPGTWVIRVPQRHGAATKKGTGTTDKRTAERMESMVTELAARREWELLEAVQRGDGRDRSAAGTRPDASVTLGELFDAWRAGPSHLEALKARLNDVDVQPLIGPWLDSVRAKLGDSPTLGHYEMHVGTLIPEGKRFARSELTYPRIAAWLAGLKVTDPTKRTYRAALSSFCVYLVRSGVLTANPVRDVTAPKAGAPRRRYLDQSQVIRLVEGQEEPFRTLSAIVHGTGMEISVALGLKRGDVDTLRKTAHAAGTKTRSRDRIAYIAEWAWPYVERHIKALTPAAPLFPDVTRWRAGDVHRAACKALGEGFEDYRMHDARHTYAVRAIRAGAPFEVVAAQLGHADTLMVIKVYGRFRPSDDEFRKWERIAAVQDAAQAKANAPGA